MELADDDLGRHLDAYGPSTSTAGHLRALLDGDDDARTRAVRHLWSAALHQGTPWTVTPVVTELLCRMLDDGALPADLRVELLEFLGAVAQEGTVPYLDRADLEAAVAAHPDVEALALRLHAEDRAEELYEDPDLTAALLGRAALGCRELLPRVLATAERLTADPDEAVRDMAARVVETAREADGL